MKRFDPRIRGTEKVDHELSLSLVHDTYNKIIKEKELMIFVGYEFSVDQIFSVLLSTKENCVDNLWEESKDKYKL